MGTTPHSTHTAPGRGLRRTATALTVAAAATVGVTQVIATNGTLTPTAVAAKTAAEPTTPDALRTRAPDVLNDGNSGDLGTARLKAQDRNLRPVPLSGHRDAAFLTLNLGDPNTRSWTVSLAHKGDNPRSTTGDCATPTGVVSCAVGQAPDGTIVATTVIVTRIDTDLGPSKKVLVDPDALTEDDLGGLVVQREVKAFRTDGSSVSVTESVRAPKTLTFERAFTTPIADLDRLATDPALVAPSR